jgi:hypothetical protein
MKRRHRLLRPGDQYTAFSVIFEGVARQSEFGGDA